MRKMKKLLQVIVKTTGLKKLLTHYEGWCTPLRILISGFVFLLPIAAIIFERLEESTMSAIPGNLA